MDRLTGKLVVVPPEAGGEAARLAGEGAAVLVVGTDGSLVGALVASLRGLGARTSGFVGDVAFGSAEAAEMAAELFPGYEIVGWE